MAFLNEKGVERLWQHVITKTGDKADKIILEDGTTLNLKDVYNAIPEGGGTSEGEGNNSTIIGGSENAIATGDNSIVIGESGTAAGAVSIAGGTNQIEIVQNLVWTTDSAEPQEAQPAQALGDMSIAYGPNTITYTTGSTAIGTGAKAGCKGFYWYDYEAVVGLGEPIGDIYGPDVEITQEIIDNGIIITDFCTEIFSGPGVYDTDAEYTWTTLELVDCTKTLLLKFNPDTINVGDIINLDYYILEDDDGGELVCPYGKTHEPYAYVALPSEEVKIILSRTQPRITYTEEDTSNMTESEYGGWEQAKVWDDECITELAKWQEGDIISFYGGHKHTNCSIITGVDSTNGTITVDSLPDPWESSDGVPVATVQWDEYLIFVPERPDAGVIEATLGAFAIGLETAASGMASFAQGFGSHAAGSYAVATGLGTEAGYAAASFGSGTKANDLFSIAGGLNSQTNARQSFAMGHFAIADGESSVALNSRTNAKGAYSTTLGRYTTAGGAAQLVQGRRNIVDTEIDSSGYGKYLHIVGNSKDSTPSNAYTLDWSGNGWFAGNIKIGGSSYDDGIELATKNDIPDQLLLPGNGTSSFVLDVSDVGSSYANTAAGKASVALGRKCTAGADESTNVDAFAGGYNCKATHGKSFAYGQNLTTTASHQFLVGRYSDTIPTNALFVVANGTSSSDKSNGFIVNTSGNGIFAGSITMNSNETLKTRTLTIEYDDGTASETIQMVVV